MTSHKHKISGESVATEQQLIEFVKTVNKEFDPLIAGPFLAIGKLYNIRGDIAFCQSIHETNWFRFGGDVKKGQHNYAGIGATGGVNGHTFASVKEGVEAQIQHLYAYATNKDLPKGRKLIDPRFEKVRRGSAPYWEELGGKWAVPGYNPEQFQSFVEAYQAGETYGHFIIRLFQKLVNKERYDMPNFKQYSMEEFQSYMEGIGNLNRNITHIQIHHTWKPTKQSYEGESTIVGMWRYHTEQRGWQDIAQHFSIAPDGTIWDGRSLELDPAGIAGHNDGGLMFEIIGNFNEGAEQLEGKQLEAVVAAVRASLEAFQLSLDDIVFHREYARKTCPGSGITKEWFLNQIKGNANKTVSASTLSSKPEWKVEAINWMYEQGLLTSEDWKGDIEMPLPLWAQAIVYRRIYQQVGSKISENGGNQVNGGNYPDGTEKWKKEAVDWMYEQGLLNVGDWKSQIEEGLPLWAESIVLKRLLDKLSD